VKQGPYSGKRVTVMGLGLFGGGVGAARFFAENGALVTVTDLRTEKDLRPSMDALKDLNVCFVLGRHDAEDFRRADIVVVNPGVALDSPLVTMARGAGAQIERSMNLLFKLTDAHAKIGITGSNGKSTTTALTGEMVRLADSRALVGGNIGKCLLAESRMLPAGAPLVLELSSFMLEGLREIQTSPNVAIVTNLSPNHLDRHGSMDAYAEAKKQILAYQRSTDVAVLNADCPIVSTWDAFTAARVIRFSVQSEPEGDAAFLDGEKLVVRLDGQEEVVALRRALRLPGTHNVANALAASAAALAFGVKPWQIAEALATFSGLPHRLEMVARGPQQVTFYNDSIATTPESAICALQSFEGPITLIAGGYDKGSPFDELGLSIAQRARRLIVMGVTAPKIEEAVRRASSELMRGPEILRARDLEHAMQLSMTDAVPNEVVLLSPACASYDMFRNFQERGELFRVLARRVSQAS